MTALDIIVQGINSSPSSNFEPNFFEDFSENSKTTKNNSEDFGEFLSQTSEFEENENFGSFETNFQTEPSFFQCSEEQLKSKIIATVSGISESTLNSNSSSNSIKDLKKILFMPENIKPSNLCNVCSFSNDFYFSCCPACGNWINKKKEFNRIRKVTHMPKFQNSMIESLKIHIFSKEPILPWEGSIYVAEKSIQKIQELQESPSEISSNSFQTDQYGFIICSNKPNYEAYEKHLENQLIAWDKFMVHYPENFSPKNRTLKQLIRNGIPDKYRPKLWLALTGADKAMQENKGYYQSILNRNKDKTSNAIREINEDIDRTLTSNIFFRSGIILAGLRRVLVAFSWHNPEVGYCQGTGFICGMLLLLMSEEETFWMFTTIVEKLLPKEYFSPNLIGSRLDQLVFTTLVSQKLPALYQVWQQYHLDINIVLCQWFISIYINVLPVETALRVWDVFFNEGSKILFRVGLALLKISEKELIQETEEAQLLNLLKSIASNAYDVNHILHVAFYELGSFPMKRITNLRKTVSTKEFSSLEP